MQWPVLNPKPVQFWIWNLIHDRQEHLSAAMLKSHNRWNICLQFTNWWILICPNKNFSHPVGSLHADSKGLQYGLPCGRLPVVYWHEITDQGKSSMQKICSALDILQSWEDFSLTVQQCTMWNGVHMRQFTEQCTFQSQKLPNWYVYF